MLDSAHMVFRRESPEEVGQPLYENPENRKKIAGKRPCVEGDKSIQAAPRSHDRNVEHFYYYSSRLNLV